MLAALGVAGVARLLVDRPAPDAIPVLVASTTVPVGMVLGPEQVQLRRVPAPAVPAGALSNPEQAMGRAATSPLVPGEVLTPADVHTPSLLAGQPEGTLASYLPLADPAVVASVRAGDRIDVHSPLDGARVVSQVRVLSVLGGGTGPGIDQLSGAAAGHQQGGVWLAVDPDQAEAIAAARGADPAGVGLSVALYPP